MISMHYTYVLRGTYKDGYAIECLRCGMVSHNPEDVKNTYCGFCGLFHLNPHTTRICVYGLDEADLKRLNEGGTVLVLPQADDRDGVAIRLVNPKTGKVT